MESFNGFGLKALSFLKKLKANNNREWFKKHKEEYVKHIQHPSTLFVKELGEMLNNMVSPGINYDARLNNGSLMRIYRDTRFSKDKTPYKTWVGIVFWQGSGKKTEEPGFYLGFSPEGLGIHAGVWQFTREQLSRYRDAVDDDTQGEKLQQLLKDLQKHGYLITGERYARVPRGFDPDHPRADLLKYKGIHSSCEVKPGVVTQPDLVEFCLQHYQKMAPLQQWMVKNLSP